MGSLLKDVGLSNLLIFDWFVARTFFDAFDLLYLVIAFDDFTKDGVLIVEPFRLTWSSTTKNEVTGICRLE